MLKVI